MTRKLKTKFDEYLQNMVFSMIVMGLLFWPTGITHELGHGIVCWATGGEFLWEPIFTHLVLICHPFPEQQKEISWAMGGTFGIIASMIPPFTFKVIRKRKFLFNGFIGCGFMQAGYAIFESSFNEMYRINDLSVVGTIALMGIIAIIVFTLREKTHN